MLQEGTQVGTVLEKQSLVGLENIFIRLREVELIVDVARDDNSWEQKLYLIQGLTDSWWSYEKVMAMPLACSTRKHDGYSAALGISSDQNLADL